jgi:hypothetical protein
MGLILVEIAGEGKERSMGAMMKLTRTVAPGLEIQRIFQTRLLFPL